MWAIFREESGREALKDIWCKYYQVDKKYALPFIATTTTRRLNIERADNAGLAQDIVADNIKFLNSVRDVSSALRFKASCEIDQGFG